MALASFFNWPDRFESTLVENPEDRFSHDKAQLLLSYRVVKEEIIDEEQRLPCFNGRVVSWVSLLEPPHDKTNNVVVCPAKTQLSLGIRPVWSVFPVRMKKAWVLSYPLSAQRKLIRLGGCPGWLETSLGAQPLCWFCHEVADLYFTHFDKVYEWQSSWIHEWRLQWNKIARHVSFSGKCTWTYV